MSQQHTLGKTATSIWTRDGMTHIQYHQTSIVIYDSSHIILNSGGWHTATTKTRMNQASNQFGLGYIVFQKDYSWFVQHENKTIDFVDGMVLSRK